MIVKVDLRVSLSLSLLVSPRAVYHLLNKIRDFNEWGQCLVLELLLKYNVEAEDEVYELMVRGCQ